MAHGFEKVLLAALAALEDDLNAVAAGVVGPSAAERRAGGDGRLHGQSMKAELLAGVAGGVSAGDDGAADARAAEHFAQGVAGVAADGVEVERGGERSSGPRAV
ncbi:MAG: hypothetical protein R2748_01995 [Bryobacterales bacterium]